MDVGLLKYSYSYKWDHNYNTTSPKKLDGTWTWCFFVIPTFSESRGVAGFFGCKSWKFQSHGGFGPDDVPDVDFQVAGGFKVVSRCFLEVSPYLGDDVHVQFWWDNFVSRYLNHQPGLVATWFNEMIYQILSQKKKVLLPWMGYLNVVPRYQGVQHSECFILMA